MPSSRGMFAAASVKHKLFALFGCILAGFCLVFAVDYLGSRRLERTQELERLSVTAALEVLSMRRQEKNYFLRHDPASLAAVRRHQQAAATAIAAIGDLDPERDDARETALRLLREYLDGFLALSDNPEAPAVDGPAALFLERSQVLDRLEGASPVLARGLAQLRSQEKRWLASGAPDSLTRLAGLAAQLAALARNQGEADAATALAAYQEALQAYAGRLESAGSQSAAFVAAARALEPVTEELRRHYETRRRAIDRDTDIVTTGIQAGVIVLVALASWAVFRSVATPLAVLGRHARRVARGEETNLDPANFTGEFRALAEDIGRMERHLVATILDLARKEREAAEEARRAREARKHAEELSRVKSNFLSLVSHELKTPLTSMIGFAQVMKKRLERGGPLAEAAASRPDVAAECARFHENLDIMLDEGRRLAGLIENVLELASLESGDAALNLGPVSVAEVIDRAVEPFVAAMTEKGLRFLREVPEGMPRLRCDRERLVYVLRHLFSNAVKFTDAGHIACRVNQENGMAVITVEDTGRGIPSEMREAVFEKFLQLGDSLTDKMPGLGIGLAASRAVVEYHGGRIRIAGEPGRGSSVTIAIPLAEAA
ncbi:MAG: HAMP domain-containing sensor histidine kinase [Solidesulfovibrio sp.]|uniref:sensor histidine kinase n=1 Tax=Solidesulfovibrio sp. TaxID=2910990 RepID=UPI003158CA91